HYNEIGVACLQNPTESSNLLCTLTMSPVLPGSTRRSSDFASLAISENVDAQWRPASVRFCCYSKRAHHTQSSPRTMVMASFTLPSQFPLPNLQSGKHGSLRTEFR